MTTLDRITSDHVMKSQEDYELNAQFAAEMRAIRADVAERIVETLEKHKPKVGKRVVVVHHANGDEEYSPDWFVSPAVQRGELTPAEIARMNARTAETERQDDYDSSTEGHW